MNTSAPPTEVPLDNFPILAGLTASQRCEFALATFPDDPRLPAYLEEQGMDPDAAAEYVSLAQSWAAAGKRGFTPEEREQADQIISGPPVVLDARAGLTESTRQYLQTLRPGQSVNLARIRQVRVLKPRALHLHTPRQQRAARRCSGLAAIAGGSDDGPADGDGEPPACRPVAQPPAPTLPAAPHTAERKRLLASYCACCGRPLCDAASASIGVGPTCRKRLGITPEVGHRLAANETMSRIVEAGEDGDAETVLRLVAELRALDPAYSTLADRIDERWLKIMAPFCVMKSTSRPDTHLAIKTPYAESFVDFCRNERLTWLPKPIKAWAFHKDKLPAVLDEVDVIYAAPDVLTTDLKPAYTLTAKVVI